MVHGTVTDIENIETLSAARQGDMDALQELFLVHKTGLFRLLYRLLSNRADSEDLLQECWLRAQRGIRDYRGDVGPSLRAWWFGIASHLALDHLRCRKRWREEAQLIGEAELDSNPDEVEKLAAVMSAPEFKYEVKEHIAFCFACIGRTLDPVEEAALLLREVFAFDNLAAARVLGLSEPTFRHRLTAARRQMIKTYDGLCQLINKTGRCYQCVTLREFAPEPQRGELITKIEPAGKHRDLSEALLDGRIAIARNANLEDGGSHKLHSAFFASISLREEDRL